MKKAITWLTALALVLGVAPTPTAPSNPGPTAPADWTPGLGEYVVLYREGVAPGAARAAIRAAGGAIIRENVGVGVATVKAADPAFLRATRRQSALAGATPNLTVGRNPRVGALGLRELEPSPGSEWRRDRPDDGSDDRGGPQAGADPLAPLQWDMQMIGATKDGSHAVQAGDRRVLVGIIDGGVDGKHPDIAPNFSFALSRNFTTDIPAIDGPCEEEADRSCNDPVDVDEEGHGTHVAGIVGAPINGIGIAGVAPNVTLVSLRAGQDSGFFLLQSVVDALTYAGDIGIDVANMSFYIDPWLYNCPNNPADPPEAQLAQQTVIAATQRALDYARARGVTLIAAAGNGHTDLGGPRIDASSPNYPSGAQYTRAVDNSCLTMPTEGDGVIGVTSIGPSGRKAHYSDYGVEQADVAAPGGDLRDFFGTDRYRRPTNLVLAPYPRAALGGDLSPDGTPRNPTVVRDCRNGVCAYYKYLQGSSMAAPHATGVAALIVSQYGARDRRRGDGLTLSPARTERLLRTSARDRACPEPRLLDYPDGDLGDEFTAYCAGEVAFNGFYGEGIVDALGAVGGRR